MAAMTPQVIHPGKSVLASRSMRLSGPNQYDTENFNAGGAINVQKPLPILAPLAHIFLRLKARLTVTVNITDAPPEAPMSLLQLIKIFGQHVSLGAQTPFQMSGETAWRLPAILDRTKGNLSFLKINGVFYDFNDIAKGTLTPTFFSTASSPYDIEVWWAIPTYPFGAADGQAMLYLWDARSWGQTLQIQFQCRDASATGAFGTTGTKALSAFGSASGVPTLDILLDYAMLGPSLDGSIAKAVLVRNASPLNAATLQAAAGSNTRLLLLQNQKTTNVLVKTGTLETGSNQVYATLSDSILEQTVLLKNSNPIRNLQFNDVTDALTQFREGRRHAPGYLVIEASEGEPANNPHAAIRANEWDASTQFSLASQVVGPAAANIGEALQEYIVGEPAVAKSVLGK